MRCRQSARFTPAAAMRISTSPAFGSGTGRVAGTSTSGPPGLLISMTVWVAGMLASTAGPPGRVAAPSVWQIASLAPGRRRWYAARRGMAGASWLRSSRWWICGRWPRRSQPRATGCCTPARSSLFGFIGFTVLKIPGGWSNPLYLAPLFVSAVLTYGMFWFVWAYFGALIAFACLAGPYVLAEITGSMLPIRVRSMLVFVAFARQHRVRRHGGAYG